MISMEQSENLFFFVLCLISTTLGLANDRRRQSLRVSNRHSFNLQDWDRQQFSYTGLTLIESLGCIFFKEFFVQWRNQEFLDGKGGRGEVWCLNFDSENTFFFCQCFLTRNWLDQMTTTNCIISSQALIIIRSKRNTFIIRNQNKRKSSLNLVAKFKNFNVNLLLQRVVTTVSLYRLTDSPGKRIQRQKK